MEKASAHKYLVLTLVILTSLVNPFMGAAVNIALPQIGEEFSMNAITMSWVAMSFLLSSAVFLVPLGKLADIVGRKRIFFWGNVIVTLATLLCAVSNSTWMLITFRVFLGMGSAMMFGTSMAIVTSVFPPHERGKALGISVTAVYLGLSAAPLLGGMLTQLFGWRSIFLVPIPTGLFVAVATRLFVKTEWADARHDSFDLKGSIVYTLAMFALMYGFSEFPNVYAIALAFAGILGLLLFIRIESGTDSPILNIDLFRGNRVFAFSNLAALINYATTFAVTFVLSLYLQYVKGLSPRDAGVILVSQPAMMALVASFAGKLSDRYDPRILSSSGMGIIMVGLVMLTFINGLTSIPFIMLCLIVLGVGFGMFTSPNTNSVMGSVDRKYLGIASATIGTMRLTGQMLSMGIATLVLSVFIGTSKLTPGDNPGFLRSAKVIFIVFSVLCLFGIFASLARGKRERRVQPSVNAN
jgi:EmrB/QacA subfamily drug resistance transporter